MVSYLDGVLSLFDAAMTTGMDIQKGKIGVLRKRERKKRQEDSRKERKDE